MSNFLTSARAWGTVKTPNFVRRHKRLSCLPRTGKSLVVYSAYHAAGVSIGRLAHVGEKLRPGFREGPAASRRPGSVVSRLFLFKLPNFVRSIMSDSSVNRRVSPRSLPSSLTHFSRSDALERARALARFLQDATEAMALSDELNKRTAYGMFQCFELLNDKLDIASGAYQFPLAGKFDDPELCHREDEGND